MCTQRLLSPKILRSKEDGVSTVHFVLGKNPTFCNPLVKHRCLSTNISACHLCGRGYDSRCDPIPP
jgi:hypothetical protein